MIFVLFLFDCWLAVEKYIWIERMRGRLLDAANGFIFPNNDFDVILLIASIYIYTIHYIPWMDGLGVGPSTANGIYAILLTHKLASFLFNRICLIDIFNNNNDNCHHYIYIYIFLIYCEHIREKLLKSLALCSHSDTIKMPCGRMIIDVTSNSFHRDQSPCSCKASVTYADLTYSSNNKIRNQSSYQQARSSTANDVWFWQTKCSDFNLWMRIASNWAECLPSRIHHYHPYHHEYQISMAHIMPMLVSMLYQRSSV